MSGLEAVLLSLLVLYSAFHGLRFMLFGPKRRREASDRRRPRLFSRVVHLGVFLYGFHLLRTAARRGRRRREL